MLRPCSPTRAVRLLSPALRLWIRLLRATNSFGPGRTPLARYNSPAVAAAPNCDIVPTATPSPAGRRRCGSGFQPPRVAVEKAASHAPAVPAPAREPLPANAHIDAL